MKKKAVQLWLWPALILIGIAIYWVSQKEDESTLANTEAKIIEIGVILPLTGELSSKAEMINQALNISVTDTNEFLTIAGFDFQFRLVVKDSQSDPDEGLKQAKQLYKEGISIFIAGASQEIEALKPWADTEDVVVLSYSSTAPSLSEANDGIFRIVPNDHHQANGLATLLTDEEIEYVIPVSRDDIYGNELLQLFVENYKMLSPTGNIAEPIQYQPDKTDFEAIAKQIEDATTLNDTKTGVMLIAFDEATEIFKASKHLTAVQWYGTETLTRNEPLMADKEAFDFAKEVAFTGLSFSAPETDIYQAIAQKIADQAEVEVIPTAVFAYDIIGLLMSVSQKMDTPGDPIELKENLISLSENYAGATGWIVLDDAGDRKYSNYDVWQVDKASENKWINRGTYQRDPGLPGYINYK